MVKTIYNFGTKEAIELSTIANRLIFKYDLHVALWFLALEVL